MKPLQPFPFSTPGIFGLNKQKQTTILGPEWATVATDLVIDDKGRLASRKGYRQLLNSTTTGVIETVHLGINNSGTKTTYCSDQYGSLYEQSAGVWANRTGAVSLPSNGNWKFVNFNGKVIAWHADGRQVVQSAVGANFANITASSGSVPQGVDILAAFGRLWVVTNTTLYYSGLLNETDWASTGGSFNLKYAWPKGADIAVGLAEFNGRLLVFGQSSIVMYGNDAGMTITDPATNMVLLDTIDNIGCINRDTIQKTGSDILFLSNVGLQSFGRVVQERSSPITDVVPQVKDYVSQLYAASTAARITSAYASDYGLYLLSLKDAIIAVDTRLRLPDGSFRVTEWAAADCVGTYDGNTYMAHGNVLSYYTGILDGVLFNGTGGTSVDSDWESGWFDWDAVVPGVGHLDKFLKRYRMSLAGGGSGTLQLKWYFNYGESATTRSIDIPAAPNAAQYGYAQYGIDKYGTSVEVTDISKPGAKGGRVIKVGAKITGCLTDFAINNAILYATLGKQAH